MGQITATRNLVATKVVRHAGQLLLVYYVLVEDIETVSPEGTFCDTVQVPSNGGDMELI